MVLSSPIEIIKKSVNIFFDKKNITNFIKIYLPLLPFALFSIWQTSFVKTEVQLKDPKVVTMVALVNLVYLIVYLWVWVAGVIGISRIVNNESIDVKDVYKKSWKMFWKFSLLSFTLFLIEFGGILLLIVPALIFGIWYSLSKFLFIDKEYGIKESLIKSKELTRGNFWKLMGRYFVFALFSALFGMLVSILPYGLGGIITTIFGALFVLPYYLLYLELVESYKN